MLCSCNSHGLNNGSLTHACAGHFFLLSVIASVDLGTVCNTQNEPSGKEIKRGHIAEYYFDD